jgi:hypothetical protein
MIYDNASELALIAKVRNINKDLYDTALALDNLRVNTNTVMRIEQMVDLLTTFATKLTTKSD